MSFKPIYFPYLMPSSSNDHLNIGGEEPLAVSGHLGSEEPIVKPTSIGVGFFV
jgi:hypothetical protein